MTPKLLKASDVCALTQLQPYILRSWEKEFPSIGVQKSPDAPRLYRQADVDQVRRIKQLVFDEGLTLSGARRRIEEALPVAPLSAEAEVADVLDALASDARTRIASVRDGLRSILRMLDGPARTVVVVEEFALEPPSSHGAAPPRVAADSRPTASVVPVAATGSPAALAVVAKPARPAKAVPAPSRAKAAAASARSAPKRSRA